MAVRFARTWFVQLQKAGVESSWVDEYDLKIGIANVDDVGDIAEQEVSDCEEDVRESDSDNDDNMDDDWLDIDD
jgi:hypothetical protein